MAAVTLSEQQMLCAKWSRPFGATFDEAALRWKRRKEPGAGVLLKQINTIYEACHDMVWKQGVEKVKAIGDALMAVSV